MKLSCCVLKCFRSVKPKRYVYPRNIRPQWTVFKYRYFVSSPNHLIDSKEITAKNLIARAFSEAQHDLSRAINLIESNIKHINEKDHLELVFYVLGDLYTKSDKHNEALAYLSKALETAIKVNVPQDPRLGKFHVYFAKGLIKVDRYKEAEENLLTALSYFDKDKTITDADTADLLSNISNTLMLQDKKKDTLIFLKRELDIYNQNPNLNAERRIEVLRYLGDIYGELEEADTSYIYMREVYDHYIRTYPKCTSDLAQFYLAFSKVCMCASAPDIWSATDALVTCSKYFEQQSQEGYLLDALETLSHIYYHTNNNEKLIVVFEKSIKLLEKQFGQAHPEIVRAYNNLALVLGEEGKEEEARLLFEKSISICTKYGFTDQECYSVAMTGLIGSHTQQVARNNSSAQF